VVEKAKEALLFAELESGVEAATVAVKVVPF
jgi:hypothetical protein